MKKILKPGNTSKKWVAHCYTCDAEFEYEASDIHYNQYIHHTTVSCPQCGSEISHRNNPCSQISTENF